MRSKGQISLNFNYHVIFKDFYTKFCAYSTNKRRYIEQNFFSVAGVMPQGWDLGVLVVQNFSVGFCNGAPLTAHSSLQFNLVIFTTKVNRFKIFCVGNSSYSFMPIPLKIYRYLGHGLKMCISFGKNPQFNFCNFFAS